jgi:excisionase family DNA binding protein
MKLLRADKVAEILDVSQARVYELIRLGILPSVSLGRQKRVSEEALNRFIEKGGQSLPGGWRRDPAEQACDGR